MSIEQLKAQAYDALVQIEQWQAKLRDINQQIVESLKETKEEEK
jgi:hypothetical protein